MNLSARSVRILGLDPGLLHTGWAVIERRGQQLTFLEAGVISPNKELRLGQRLAILYDRIDEILRLYTPDTAAIEETFVNKNGQTTLKLGHARGVVLLVPERHGLEVAEYAPTRIKKTVTGNGHADKAMMEKMMSLLFPKLPKLGADSYDALAVCVTHERHI